MSNEFKTNRNQAVYARIVQAFKEGLDYTKQTQIADALGIHKQKVQDWKRGKAGAEKYIAQISKLTGRSAGWLLTGEEEEQGEDQGFRESPFYRLYIASKKAEPEDKRLIEDFIQIALRRLGDKLESQGNVKKNRL